MACLHGAASSSHLSRPGMRVSTAAACSPSRAPLNLKSSGNFSTRIPGSGTPHHKIASLVSRSSGHSAADKNTEQSTFAAQELADSCDKDAHTYVPESEPRTRSVSRRVYLTLGAATLAASTTPFGNVGSLYSIAALAAPTPSGERSALLSAIERGEGVLEAIAALNPLDPSEGLGAVSSALGGSWELLWCSSDAEPAGIAKLVPGLRPQSSQLLGTAADARGGGPDRVYQVQSVANGGARLELSSGAVPYPGKPNVIDIQPPFKLDVVLGGRRINLVTAGSDADFRAVNTRTAEEQAAPRNQYEQKYLEETGQAGDLRISEVIEGDPVVVGTVYVHRRIA